MNTRPSSNGLRAVVRKHQRSHADASRSEESETTTAAESENAINIASGHAQLGKISRNGPISVAEAPCDERTGFRATGFRDAAPGTSAAGAVRLGGSGWCSFSLKS
ncbi:hypothetical protein L596_000380 [Steinernema carpocapsae]|uniref:Uncharacterized protein n=1 Tax=Steinernema carpocapsae TaxID=34508 RepID=A0A4U8UKD0_STECR|nr:hypothetical protein L596_000380 [Steinernema carpocapsae]